MRKLYLFVNSKSNMKDWLDCMSITDDGHILGCHVCSHMAYMMHDLHDRPDRLERVKAHFKDEPYEIEILSYEDGKDHTEFNKAIELAKKIQYESAGIEIEVTNESA